MGQTLCMCQLSMNEKRLLLDPGFQDPDIRDAQLNPGGWAHRWPHSVHVAAFQACQNLSRLSQAPSCAPGVGSWLPGSYAPSGLNCFCTKGPDSSVRSKILVLSFWRCTAETARLRRAICWSSRTCIITDPGFQAPDTHSANLKSLSRNLGEVSPQCRLPASMGYLALNSS